MSNCPTKVKDTTNRALIYSLRIKCYVLSLATQLRPPKFMEQSDNKHYFDQLNIMSFRPSERSERVEKSRRVITSRTIKELIINNRLPVGWADSCPPHTVSFTVIASEAKQSRITLNSTIIPHYALKNAHYAFKLMSS